MENKKVYGVAVKKSEIPKTVYGAAKLKETNYAVLKEAADFVANGGHLFSEYDNNSDNTHDLVDVVRSQKQEQTNLEKIKKYKTAIQAALNMHSTETDANYKNALKDTLAALENIKGIGRANSQFSMELLLKNPPKTINNTSYDNERKNSDFKDVVAREGSVAVGIKNAKEKGKEDVSGSEA